MRTEALWIARSAPRRERLLWAPRGTRAGRLLAAGCLLCLCGGVGSVHAQAPRYQFAAGQTAHIVFAHEAKTTSAIFDAAANKTVGPTRQATVTQGLECDWRVLEVEADGAARVAQTIRRLSMKLASEGAAPLAFDSAAEGEPAPEARALAAAARPLVGAVFTLRISPRGEITALAPPEAPEATPADSRDKLASLFPPERVRELVSQAALVFPENAPAEGASWERVTTAATPLGTLTQTHTFRLAGEVEEQGRKLLRVLGETKLALRDSPGKLSIVEQKQSSECLFDVAAGQFARMTVRQRLATQKPFRDLTIRALSETTLTVTFTPEP